VPSPRTNELPVTGPERENTARLPLPSTIAGSHPGGNVFVPTVVAAGPIHDSCADSAPGWIAVHSASLDTATQPAFRGGATDTAPAARLRVPHFPRAPPPCLRPLEELRHRGPARRLRPIELQPRLAAFYPHRPGAPDLGDLPRLRRSEPDVDALARGHRGRDSAADARAGEAHVDEVHHVLAAALQAQADESVGTEPAAAPGEQAALLDLPREAGV